MRTRKFIYYSLEKKIRFAAIPKNASVTIREYIYGMNVNGPFYEKGIEPIHPECLKFPLFAVVRNPVDRWFSTYKYLYENGFNKMPYDHYVFNVRNAISLHGDPQTFNPHLVRQTDYLEDLEPDIVISMDHLDYAFTDLPVRNASNKKGHGVLDMPDDIQKYYNKDLNLYKHYKQKNGWRKLTDLRLNTASR